MGESKFIRQDENLFENRYKLTNKIVIDGINSFSEPQTLNRLLNVTDKLDSMGSYGNKIFFSLIAANSHFPMQLPGYPEFIIVVGFLSLHEFYQFSTNELCFIIIRQNQCEYFFFVAVAWNKRKYQFFIFFNARICNNQLFFFLFFLVQSSRGFESTLQSAGKWSPMIMEQPTQDLITRNNDMTDMDLFAEYSIPSDSQSSSFGNYFNGSTTDSLPRRCRYILDS